MLQKIFFQLLVTCLLAGCATSNNTLNIAPAMVLPTQDPSLMGVTISINGADRRQHVALAKVNRDGKLMVLTASRDLRFLLQEVLEKQMVARGYMIASNGAAALQILVNNLYSDVEQGDLRHNITSKADISIIAQAKNGNKFTKNYRASYNVQGAFTATNGKIADSVNSVLSDVISDMAKDTDVSGFIKQNTR